MVLYGTSVVKERVMTKASMSKHRQKGGDEAAVRERILEAAFAAFMKNGYATTSTLEIATRARFEAGALRASWQQTGNADRLHPRARQATGRAR
jgi:Bacterial regulatory proteins, tetR family